MSTGTKAGALLPVETALKRILTAARARVRGIETVPVAHSCGRVLAADISALRTQPPFAMSAMDGFALQAADTNPPGQALRVIGESAAGHPFSGVISTGEAARIFTGAKLPEGADAVLIQERATLEGAIMRPEIALANGTFVRKTGADFKRGEQLLAASTRLAPRHIALAAAMDHAEIPVFRRPRIALLATGDELVLPGADKSGQGTVATNILAIVAMVRLAGGEPIDLGIARDNSESLEAAFVAAGAAKADCLVTIGGASVGKHDLVRPVARALGAELDFYRIAMRPGKPLNFGALGDMLLLGLPGNPVSSMVCAQLFLLPLIETLLGLPDAERDRSVAATLASPLPANDERQDYLRVSLSKNVDGVPTACPAGAQESSLVSVLSRADGLLIRPPFAPAADIGDVCRVILF